MGTLLARICSASAEGNGGGLEGVEGDVWVGGDVWVEGEGSGEATCSGAGLL